MGLTQIISTSSMYLTHYALFEEPDDGVPKALYLDPTKVLNFSLDLTSPIGVQHFSGPNNNLTGGWNHFKQMTYGIAPAGLVPPLDPRVVEFFKIIVPGIDPTNIVPQIIAAGQFLFDPGSPVSAKYVGNTFEVTKKVHFRVQILVTFLYPPSHIGLVSPPVTNAQAAGFWAPPLPIPPGTDPNGALTYEWSSVMTLSTANSYVRTVVSQPPPFADPFEPGTAQIELTGSPVDGKGNYTIVGATVAPAYIASPTSTVPDILGKLFGSNILNDCELAYSETGNLLAI